jgi:Xaa-Pro aminopeptidase
MFRSEVYIERRRRLSGQVQSGVILLQGNNESPMNYPDNQYPFRQDSSFLYFFGLDSPGLAGVIDVDEGKEYVFGDDLTVDDIVWTGPLPTVAERCEAIGDMNSYNRVGVLVGHGRTLLWRMNFRPRRPRASKMILSP